ncbi:MAG: hypothetical protein KDC70_09685 [Saprospiraceae bacterium]|nr:hypothetical protein [Saprospiraceae bacterium]
MKKESLDKELEGLSPKLQELRRENDGFRLPDSYFESLEEAVFSRLDAAGARRQQELTVSRGKGLFSIRWMATAAAVLAVILAAVWFFKPAPVAAPQPVALQLTEEEIIESYVLENIRDFEVEQLAALSTEHEVESSPAPPNQQTTPKGGDLLDNMSAEEMELLLKEMTDEELESLL